MKKLSNKSESSTKPEVAVDLPFYPVVIGDKTYKLCFDMNELEKAEEFYSRQGHYVNMLIALDVGSMNLKSVRTLFAAAARTFHPELGFDEARALVTMGSIYIVTTAMLNAFADAKDAEFKAATETQSGVEAASSGGESSGEENE